MAVTAILPNAREVSNWVLVPSAAYVSTGDVTTPFNVDRFSAAEIVVSCTAITGTLDVYVQELLPGLTTYGDVAHFPQVAAASEVRLSFVSGGNSVQVVTEATLAVSTILTVNMGASWRIKWVIGTGPATFSVTSNWKGR